ncbi:dihydrofolate reductase family protein [Streptomyces sp. NPDC086783]|uniref:dihydrofolate reductase family protein n=1 Tax=Streptomyces sp. NPDC086783 TaxID=3365758 RepID=UPI00382877C8
MVTDEPVDRVLKRAFEAAGARDVRAGGGAATVQRYLRVGLIDELHLAVVPLLVGRGERLLDDVADGIGDYRVAETAASPAAAHELPVRR